ncbi:MAG: hypothetical protein ABI686_05515 [Acidobacteriota bacterium]
MAQRFAASPREAERETGIVQKRLQALGIETTILSDENLAVETQPRRLRGYRILGR